MIHHIAIPVSDLERARRFYRDVLGLSEIPNPLLDFPVAWFEAGNSQIHLITNPESRTLRGTTGIDSHDGHFALRVASYDEMLVRLESLGVPLRARPVSGVPWKRIFVTDPDGNVIELVDD